MTTAASRAPAAIIEVNGLRFARAPRKKAGTTLEPLEGLDGWYKPSVRGVLLLTPTGEPFAFACSNGGEFLVTAHLYDGRVRYMFGLTESDERRLKITSYRHGHDTAAQILSQARATPIVAAA
ncbi:MAG: hypothetical protein ACRER5_02990 [Pseudomonas sp.]